MTIDWVDCRPCREATGAPRIGRGGAEARADRGRGPSSSAERPERPLAASPAAVVGAPGRAGAGIGRPSARVQAQEVVQRRPRRSAGSQPDLHRPPTVGRAPGRPDGPSSCMPFVAAPLVHRELQVGPPPPPVRAVGDHRGDGRRAGAPIQVESTTSMSGMAATGRMRRRHRRSRRPGESYGSPPPARRRTTPAAGRTAEGTRTSARADVASNVATSTEHNTADFVFDNAADRPEHVALRRRVDGASGRDVTAAQFAERGHRAGQGPDRGRHRGRRPGRGDEQDPLRVDAGRLRDVRRRRGRRADLRDVQRRAGRVDPVRLRAPSAIVRRDRRARRDRRRGARARPRAAHGLAVRRRRGRRS